MMTKRRASPGYRDAFNYYNSVGVHREKASCSLESFSLESSIEESQELRSGVSVEEDVIQLNSQVQQLVVQVGVLANGQATAEESFTQFTQDSATQGARIVVLEEHVKEMEARGEEVLQSEQQKNKVFLGMKERENQVEIENYETRYTALENENCSLVEEIRALQLKGEIIQQDKQKMVEHLQATKLLLLKEQEEHKILQDDISVKVKECMRERQATSLMVQKMIKEVNGLRKQQVNPVSHILEREVAADRSEAMDDLTTRLGEMMTEIKKLREENKSWRENNEEMEVALLSRGLEQGRHLLTSQKTNSTLIVEIDEMGEDQMRTSLGVQKDVNLHLQTYIDNVLLNIMDRYPELLEIRNK